MKEKKKNSCRRKSTLYSKSLYSPFKRPEMALLYGLIWRVLLAVVRIKRATVSWLRVRLQTWRGRFWQRTVAALLLPVPVTEFPDYLKKARDYDGKGAESRRSRWISDGNSLKKLPVHIGFVVAEEELSYTDIANLVVWCMAVGISHVSVYDHHGIFQKNHICLQEEIVKKQQSLLGGDDSRYNMELLKSSTDKPQHFVVSCRPIVKVLSPEDGKHSIVQAARKLCHSVEKKEWSAKDISVSMLDILLRVPCPLTKMFRMKTCLPFCSSTVPVSSGLDNDVLIVLGRARGMLFNLVRRTLD
ncbi:dehydrodolichyl diphosphate synthase complex subunit nus1 isoform X2 [Girardinichthys multiradiatus]|uniref:dehydrodolichyl diphosphate synthase complex subunit nus1 isoform X2 n=1 Tax=Girardinichthys multiradiatus TaxID=208333 RepID=UPI001FAD6E5A|nr:dehydrodolichyl diphosphate synthase complex subunit nus1 isoform X2 [Girardinichthys multiradiatus]